MSAFLPDQTHVTQVHLRTAKLERALGFYAGVLGLEAHRGPGDEASVSSGHGRPALIVLSEDPDAVPGPQRSTGLYHLALRYPRRQDLARAVRRLASNHYPVAGAADHGVSEAVYLSDPDGNGVELYVDRPRSQWPFRSGQLAMGTGPLDLDELVAGIRGRDENAPPPPQTDVGHIHLHVADLGVAEQFYHEYLGLEVTQRSYPGALFLAAGGYHHHIGLNTWAGKAAPPANSVGLLSYRLEVPLTEILYCLNHRAPLVGYESNLHTSEDAMPLLRIRDPNGTWLEIESAEATTPRAAAHPA